MALIARDGKLLLGSDGNLTTREDCCCDECDCSTHKFGTFGQCDCITEAYGSTLFGVQDAVVSISGSLIPFSVRCGFSFVTPTSCVDISGSYIVPLDSTELFWVHAQYICKVPSPPLLFFPRDYYLVTIIRIRHQCLQFLFQPSTSSLAGVSLDGGDATLSVSVVSRVYTAPDDAAVPYTTLTGPLLVGELDFSPLVLGPEETYFDGPTERSAHSERVWWWDGSSGVLDDFLFLPSEACPTDCNTVIQRRQCNLGSLTPTYQGHYDSDFNSCGVSGLTITASRTLVAL